MAITITFTPASMNAEQYDQVIRRLERAGVAAPPGRLYHVCSGVGDRLRVVDVWESQEAFDAFGQTLMPILQEMHIDPGQPQVTEAHNIIGGSAAAEEHKTLVRTIYDAFNRRDFNAMLASSTEDVEVVTVAFGQIDQGHE